MPLIDDVQEMLLIEKMKALEAEQVAALRAKLSTAEMNEEAIAALQLLYHTGWMNCIEQMRKIRSR